VNDRPSAQELLEAVGRFLQDEAVPALPAHLGYQARVAANVVAIVAREIGSEDRQQAEEWERLGSLLADDSRPPSSREELRAALLARNRELVSKIRAGLADSGDWRSALVSHLKQTVADKLSVAKG
jgi:hypothetical protein